jgi:hypothetical protein
MNRNPDGQEFDRQLSKIWEQFGIEFQPYLTKLRPKKFYDAKLIFWSFATFFSLTIFWSHAKQRFCFSEIYYFINQRGIAYLSIVHMMASGNFITPAWNLKIFESK